MAGTIEVSPEAQWSVATWLFEWVLRTVASGTGDSSLASELSEIVDENLGWLSVEDLGSACREEFLSVVQSDLLVKAEGELPVDLPNRLEVIELLAQLVRLVTNLCD